MAETGIGRRQSSRFLALYAIAWAGGSIAYVPLLTVLMPARVEANAGPEAVTWLAYLAFAGAVAASLANIAAGWLSDITRNRRWWIVGGLLTSCALLPLFAHVARFEVLLVLLFTWQVALNFVLAPLAAWAGDCVPDEQKGMLGGLLAFAPPAGAAAGALVTHPGLAGPETRLLIVAALVAMAVLPVLLLGRPRPMPHLLASVTSPSPEFERKQTASRLVSRMWLARLLMQVAEAALFAYLYLWLRTLDPGFDEATTARLFFLVLTLGVPVALVVGRWSDRAGRPLAPLRACAITAAAGLAIMAFSPAVAVALAGYALFALVANIFLALHSAQVLRVLPRSERRGRDLGIFNLTNTVPSLVMPWLTLALVPTLGFTALFWVLAALAVAAASLLVSVASR